MITTFFSEKGGSGKTTFNILLASYLAYIEGKNVLYIDTDSPNFHAEGVRLREIKLYQNPENAKLFRRYIISDSLKIYDIQKIKDIRSEDNFKKVKYALASLKEQQKYDHIIIDLPGTLDNKSIQELLFSNLIDKIYMPIEEDKQLIWSAVKFASTLANRGITPYLFWNKIYTKEGIKIYDLRTQFIIENYNLRFLNTRIKNSVKIRREWDGSNCDFIRSTLCYPLRNIAQSNLSCLTDLFTEITNRHEDD